MNLLTKSLQRGESRAERSVQSFEEAIVSSPVRVEFAGSLNDDDEEYVALHLASISCCMVLLCSVQWFSRNLTRSFNDLSRSSLG